MRHGGCMPGGWRDHFVPVVKWGGISSMRNVMLWLALALVVLWALTWLVFRLANLAVHLVLLLALVMAVIWLFQRLRA
jgi:hypothetical protein